MVYVVAIAVVFIIIAVVAGFSAHVGWKLTHPSRKPLTAAPENYGLAYRKIRFMSRSGDEELAGWHILATGGRKAAGTIIFSHGYSGNRLEDGLPALALAKSLVEAGYDVLMYDFRNSGESTGKLTSVGYYEQYDVLGAIDWIAGQGAEPIILFGFSMGATSSLLAAAQDTRVAAVVADSAFSHLTRYLRRSLPVWTGLPNFPFTPLILAILPRITGIFPDAVDAVQAVDDIYPRPILFIHSRKDSAIPSSNSEELALRHPERFELWLTDEGEHVGSYAVDPEAYSQRVLSFLSGLPTVTPCTKKVPD